MHISVSLPLDSAGYLRRQCPRCERVLKWRANEDSRELSQQDLEVGHYCPYCGEVSSADQWWTDEQVEYLRAIAILEGGRILENELRPSVDQVNRSGGLVRMEMKAPNFSPPVPLFEPDDMIAVEPPCHPEEPIKITEQWDSEVHCRVCGSSFVLPA